MSPHVHYSKSTLASVFEKERQLKMLKIFEEQLVAGRAITRNISDWPVNQYVAGNGNCDRRSPERGLQS